MRGNTGGSLYTYPLATGEEIVGVAMSRGRESFEYDDVLCKIKFYIKRSDGLIFRYKGIVKFNDCYISLCIIHKASKREPL